MLHSTLFIWTFSKEENWWLLNIYQGLQGQFLRNAHCTEGVLRIGCHEISKKFQPVLEPDWSATQQYNHMFQRSTVYCLIVTCFCTLDLEMQSFMWNSNHVDLQGKSTVSWISFTWIIFCNLNNTGVNFLSKGLPQTFNLLVLEKHLAFLLEL